MKRLKRNQGFTLIELLLVIVIIGLLLAVIVPRAWRANIDTKYGLVRQNGSELASFALQWAEQGIQAQDEVASTGTLDNYFASLTAVAAGTLPTAGLPSAQWIAETGGLTNWNTPAAGPALRGITGRVQQGVGGTNAAPENSVEDVVPPDKIPRNPFNGVSVFEAPNDPGTAPVTGALACGGVSEAPAAQGWHYYALVFQGTDSTTVTFTVDTSFHAGQAAQTIAGLRNGTFLARAR